MKCHYDVLSVGRDAEDGEIKKSYRKLALLYHPDKNPDTIEEVTELFREVQSAYDVLSDPQERAWYDKHREAILRGGDDYVDDCLDLMHYFNPSVFTGFDDGTKSFYTVFRDAFCRLSKEDEVFREEDERDGDDGVIIPEFGWSYSEYESVVRPFYIYWMAYCTKKSFSWKDKYDIKQAANRPTQRLMEKENKKIRDNYRKKRNEEVRALVMYVRKRDKRVIEELKKNKIKQEEQQRKTMEKQKLQKKDRSKILENYEEQEWMAFDTSKLDDIDSHFDKQFGSVVNEDSDDEYDVLYCIACDKNFKSDKALANHEKSKKHKENVQLIKNELDADIFEELCLGNDKLKVDENNDDLSDGSTEYLETPENDPVLSRLGSMNLTKNVVKQNVIDKSTKSGEDYSIPKSKKSKKKKKQRNVLINIEEDSDNDDSYHHKTIEKTTEVFSEQEINKLGEKEEEDKSTGNNLLQDGENNKSADINDNINILNEDIPEVDHSQEETYIVHAHNNASEEEESEKEKKQTDKGNKNKKCDNPDDEVTGSFECSVCPKVFPTRNKLFKHIKSEGHAQLKEDGKKAKKMQRGQKAKK